MIIKSIKLHNFKNFEDFDSNFAKMTFIKGKNGSGKTTLALESLLFALYGFTTKEKLSDLPTRSKAKSCAVEVKIEQKGVIYTIKREYPTKVEILKDDESLVFANSREVQSFIDSTFGDRLHFMKFRMVDAYTKETNFLEEGQATLKKILFSISEDTFNKVKIKLNNIKHEREIFNKDNAVIYKNYPSEKRLKILRTGLSNLQSELNKIRSDIREIENGNIQEERTKSQLAERKRRFDSQEKVLKTSKKCYACGQELPKDKQKQMLQDLAKEIKQLESKLPEIEKNLVMSKEIIDSFKKNQDKLQLHKEILSSLIMKLEGRLKQKDYKYTTKDVIIVKKALEELDKLSSYYLTESIRMLEPIINSILEKINFKVQFELDAKGKFSINLQKESILYKYKDLSTGQKLILQVAFKLALLLEREESGIIVADEGMSSLDRENLIHILSIFENLPFQLVFVIHNLEDIPHNIGVIDLND